MSGRREPPLAAVLGPVRQLEAALESGSTARTASEARLREARDAAARRLEQANDEAVSTVAERRRVLFAAADDDAAEISRRGAELAAQARANARLQCTAVVEAALALILPSDTKEG